MATVLDVAQYILSKRGEMTAMKLQKLVYYCQAWHIAWHDDVLFPERIEAWVDGPVAPVLFNKHRGSFRVSSIPSAKAERLTKDEKSTIDKVLKFYGDKSPQWLIDLSHQEAPWRDARHGIPDGTPSNRPIPPEAMGRFYSSL
ncbi:MAG: hypothetical protein JWR80_491 [Bradyrhizobium sp.]|nr:hypothetical protein [Bradyrhizobium sp.]